MPWSIRSVGITVRAGTLAAVTSLGCAGGGPQPDRSIDAGPARLTGMYRYLADAGLFTECRSGVRIPVAMEGENATLERAYLGARSAPGEALLVTVIGRIEERPPLEGTRTGDSLIVTRFEQVWPAESCETSRIETPLENTSWRLVALDGSPVKTRADAEREVSIRLVSAEKRVTGFAGCNALTGSYEVTDSALAFGPLATTRMACPALDEEVAFTRALEETRRLLILGRSLVLSSDSGDLARFEAMDE